MLRTNHQKYQGWEETRVLENGIVQLAVTTAIGPRIVDFRLAGGENVFYLRASEVGKSGEANWVFRGGWRLWVAPEEIVPTYAPDNLPCSVEELGAAAVRVMGPVQAEAGIQKIVEVSLLEGQSRARIVSRIRNVGDRSLTYAAWSLSVMRPGGRALAPLDLGKLSAFSDTRRLILWSYARFADPRYDFGDRLIQVDHAKVEPGGAVSGERRSDESKIAVDTKQGWAAYLHGDILYVKRFPYDSSGTYPDGGSTVEIYSSAEFVEVENLSPLVTLEPGDELVYPEEWSLFGGVSIAAEEAQALRDIEHWLRKAPTPTEP